MPEPEIQEGVLLAGYTTLGLGGPARYLISCATEDDVRFALDFSNRQRLPLFVLGGGSNLVVADNGFDGVVLHMSLRGISCDPDGDRVHLTAGAGETWDDVVLSSVQQGFGGLECLSGIPGTAGATPIQNVGAYGQEVADTLREVRTIDRHTAAVCTFSAQECGFGYRASRFRGSDAGRYIITAVTFSLRRDATPVIRYPELERAVSRSLSPPGAGTPTLGQVRETVLGLRRSKAMVLDPSVPDTRSAGSFFMNPVVSPDKFARVEARWHAAGQTSPVPAFPATGGRKIPAAWLVEHSGFSKGTRRGSVGISGFHALALVNRGGTTAELLALAAEIRSTVHRKFGILLAMEPVILGSASPHDQEEPA